MINSGIDYDTRFPAGYGDGRLADMPSTQDEDNTTLTPGTAEVPQAATRALAGVALRSPDVLTARGRDLAAARRRMAAA